MPIRIEDGKTPQGHPCMRALVSGHVSLADAEAMSALLQPGGRFNQARVLCIVEKGTEYSPASRKHFSTMNGLYLRMGVVVTNSFLRATINFMTRIMSTPKIFRLFDTEAEAMAFLDQA